MLEIKKFVCEICRTEYNNLFDATICEKNHIPKEDFTISSFGYEANKRFPNKITLKFNNMFYDYYLLDYLYSTERND